MRLYLKSRLAVGRICRANDDARSRALLEVLPPLEGETPPATGEGVIYTSCNDKYLDLYVRDLLRSAALHSPAQHFHLHMYDPSPSSLAYVQDLSSRQRLTLTWEHSEKGRVDLAMSGGMYFVCARFIRMWQFLDASRSQILAIDADAVVRNDLTQGFSRHQEADIALFFRHKRRNPLRKVLGAAVMLNPTPLALRFIRDCAAVFITYAREGGWEAIDQLILYLVWRWHRRHVPALRAGQLTLPYSDWTYDDDSYVWHAKGMRKDASVPLERVFSQAGE